MTERHRPSEAFSPRPSDLIADRLRVLAAWATLTRTSITIQRVVFDGPALEQLAEEQARDEAALLQHWSAFRDFYTEYTATLKDREAILLEAIAEVAQMRSDRGTRNALRLCRLRRPPLAKVQAIVAESRLRTGTGE